MPLVVADNVTNLVLFVFFVPDAMICASEVLKVNKNNINVVYP